MTSLPSSKPRPEAPPRGAPPSRPLRALLASIVDYAGLFPPAGLDMRAAVEAYGKYRKGKHAWMLGAFVVPAARIAELAECSPESNRDDPWPLSVLAPSVSAAPGSCADGFELRALEVAPLEPAAILAGSGGAPEGVRVFYEVPLDDRMDARLDAIARAGGAAKVRAGGVTAEAFPAASRLAEFVGGCAERGVPFKATAGLHHPTYGCYALTYAPRSPTANMYGFLDLALVAALLRLRRVDLREAARLLGAGGEDLEVDSDGVRWGGHRISATEISTLRRAFFLSFGSCSFEDPVADLRGIGLL